MTYFQIYAIINRKVKGKENQLNQKGGITMSKAEMETKARNDYLDFISTKLSEQYDADVLRVSASEIAIPYVDEEGNEKWALVKVSIPRGTRNEAEEKKAAALAKKEEGKAVKKAVKNLEKAVENAE